MTRSPANLALSLNPWKTNCKICGGVSHPYGLVDFNKSCEEARGLCLTNSNVLIYYLRCTQCGFVFTNAFDNWDEREFKTYIYNEDYLKIDPDYGGARAKLDAARLKKLLPNVQGVRALDYGGGEGHLARLMAQESYKEVDTYDPFVKTHAEPPSGKYDLLTCFETLEHLPQPETAVKKIASYLNEVGLVVFSTLVIGDQARQEGINWWYIGPRNGHVSIFSRNALGLIWEKYGFSLASFGDNFHIAWRKMPTFASHIQVTKNSAQS
jgi:hypothetical protein